MNTSLALLFLTVSNSLSLPPGLLSAICFQESGHVVSAVNYNDAGSRSYGLCQIKKSTARLMGYAGSGKDLQTPQINAHYAGLYLRYQLYRYNGDVGCAISAYNAGTCRHNAKGLILNRKYVEKVLERWEIEEARASKEPR